MRDPHRDALGEGLGGGAIGHVTADEDEPLGVHVRDDVARTCHRTEPGGDRFEELRTGSVAAPFVDLGEVVELDRHHGDPPEGDLAVGEPPAQALEIEDRDARLTGIPVAARGRRPPVGDGVGRGFGGLWRSGGEDGRLGDRGGPGSPGSSAVERGEWVERTSSGGRPSRPGSSTSTTGSRSWATRAAARRARRLARSAMTVAPMVTAAAMAQTATSSTLSTSNCRRSPHPP